MGWRGSLGAAIILAFAAAGALSLAWTPWDVTALDVARRLAPPSLAHPFGTDQLGRDLLSMLMAGAVPSLATAGAAVLIGLAGGVPLGLLAAARPGWIDELVARIADLLFAFPALIVALLIVAVAGPGADRAALAIGLFNVPVFARVTRATARRLWPREFVLAARLAGKGRMRIAIEHILPNIASAIVVQASMQLAMGLLAEAGLSYLGLGVQPPRPSWGRMLADGQTLIGIAPLSVLLPGGAIVLAALGFVWLGDSLARRTDAI
jgi:peptide/nickel transport system permease protein